ncbi:MAG: hypothetical protein NVSMB56_11710 [Pyrinomonadaceae bacterium]
MSEEHESQKTPSRVGRINRRMKTGAGGDSKEWWDASQKKASRRKFIVGGALAGLGIVGGSVWLATRHSRVHDDSTDVDKDSLELQKTSGWNIGAEDKTLTFSNSTDRDSQKSDVWRKYLSQNELLRAYQPKDAAWQPFFVPTLIQSLQFDSLQKQLTPIATPDMQETYGRAQSIAKDFLANTTNANQTAIIADLPGRDAVAFGAGLAEAARVVTVFDNFPHPLGGTPSHETLAAMLYYAGETEAKQATISNNAPPVFLLDSNRLATYTDADNQFDNRYLAKLPSAAKFKEKGITSILYITPDRTRTVELDDLNDDFVAYKSNNLNVAMLPLSDLTAVQETLAKNRQANTNGTHYYYGGNPGSHYYFFHSYPFYSMSPGYARRYPNISSGGSVGGARSLSSAAPSISAPSYAPASRPTMFSGSRIGSASASGIGRSKPSGFGRSSVRVSTSTGRVTGTRAGRSGSFGRSGGGSSSG